MPPSSASLCYYWSKSPSVHPPINSSFIKHLSYASHCLRTWIYRGKEGRQYLCSHGASISFFPYPSIWYNYTLPIPREESEQILNPKPFFLCWADCSLLPVMPLLSSGKQLIAFNALAPDHLFQVFICSNSSISLSFILQSFYFLFVFFVFFLAVSLSPQIWPWVTSRPYAPCIASLRPGGKGSC